MFPLLFLQMEHLPRRLQHETRWGFPDDGGECHFSAWRTERHVGYWEHWWFWRSLDSSTSQDSWHTFSFFYQCWQLAFTSFHPISSLQTEMNKRLPVCSSNTKRDVAVELDLSIWSTHWLVSMSQWSPTLFLTSSMTLGHGDFADFLFLSHLWWNQRVFTYVYLPPNMFHWNVGHGGMVTGLGWEDLFTPARSAGRGWGFEVTWKYLQDMVSSNMANWEISVA